MKTYGGMERELYDAWLRHLLEVSGQLNTGETAPGTHWIGCWVDPRAGLDAVQKKNFLALPEIEPRMSIPLKY
jgi:hypothetical protein